MKNFLLFLTAAALLSLSSIGQRLVPLLDSFYPLNEPFQGPRGDVLDMAIYNDNLVFVGDFEGINLYSDINIGQWNGTGFIGFSALPEDDRPWCIENTPGGLFVAGRMSSSDGVLQLIDNEWVLVGDELGSSCRVYDMAWFNDALHICGRFELPGLTDDQHVAKWNGSSWEPVGAGLDDRVTSLQVFEDELYAAGQFTQSGSTEIYATAKWDGSTWSQVGQALNNSAYDLELHNGELFACGAFNQTLDSATSINHLAKLVEDNWQEVPNDLSSDTYLRLEIIEDNMYVSEGIVPFNTPTSCFIVRDGVSSRTRDFEAIHRALDFNGDLITCSSLNYDEHAMQMNHVGSLNKYLSEGRQLESFESGNISFSVEPIPTLFQNRETNNAGYFTISEPGPSSIYAAAPWMGGIAEGNQIKAAYETFMADFGTTNNTYFTGPLSSVWDQEYADRYFRVWSVSQAQIDNHIANFDNSDYTVPEVIQNWPGNGRYELGEALHLAPFFDVDQDGRYEPSLGDYPVIKGDKATYYILNTGRNSEDDFSQMDVNVGVMIYAFDIDEAPYNNTTFISYIVDNHGEDLEDYRFGFWMDGDLGNAIDDYVGSQPEQNSFFTYNGDANDETAGQLGYGLNPPAQGATFLNHSLSKYVYYNIGNAQNGDPTIPSEFYNYLQGIWKDGSPMIFGGNGYNIGNPDILADFMYPSCPSEPGGVGIWSEVTEGNPPGDRRSMGSIFKEEFQNGERLCIDMVLTTSFTETPGDNIESVVQLKEDVEEIQAFYDDSDQGCGPETFPLSLKEENTSATFLLAYPNPTSNMLTIERSDQKVATATFFDMQGRAVLQKQINGRIATTDVSALSTGLYNLQIASSDGSTQVLKVLVE